MTLFGGQMTLSGGQMTPPPAGSPVFIGLRKGTYTITFYNPLWGFLDGGKIPRPLEGRRGFLPPGLERIPALAHWIGFRSGIRDFAIFSAF